ncbi:MAG: lipoprotein [Candidatus Magnetoglobus multicellularis str. Araruama]|uniref:Lipoprotein n=1 Tax=Candidatus Magnetoglobus multicellularis str. Araruama TaxID=890399 RepID=A0A1V1PEN2_9BACT|nr:MAG: lipoprotein [Candidatus Magnetoglobus multicellularis str. Araruama]
MRKFTVYLFCLVWIVSLSACQSTPKKPYNYQPYLSHMPESILVLPPINQSLEVNASYMYISIISRPIAEKGYYVFPVAVIDALMKENGVGSPEDMHRISLSKIKEIINPDAVLYVTIKEWGTQYKIIDSQTIVHVSATLIDTDSEQQIWQNSCRIVKSSNDNANNIAEMLVAALVNQVMSNFLDPTINVARMANQRMYYNDYNGLVPGKYHPLFEERQKKIKEQMK